MVVVARLEDRCAVFLFVRFLSLCYFYSAFMFLLLCCQSTVSKNINVIKTW